MGLEHARELGLAGLGERGLVEPPVDRQVVLGEDRVVLREVLDLRLGARLRHLRLLAGLGLLGRRWLRVDVAVAWEATLLSVAVCLCCVVVPDLGVLVERLVL